VVSSVLHLICGNCGNFGTVFSDCFTILCVESLSKTLFWDLFLTNIRGLSGIDSSSYTSAQLKAGVDFTTFGSTIYLDLAL
jgi:hypothetical protein